jgi:aspartate racemase
MKPSDERQAKTIGVLGGMGPQATMDLEARIHRVAQARMPSFANTGYPPMVVAYFRRVPFLLEPDGTPRIPFQPDPELIETARKLGPLVDFLVISSNAPHLFRKQLEQASGREVLSMIEVTLEEVSRRGWRRVGVVGMGLPAVYTVPLESMGIPFEILGEEQRARLNGAIVKLMEGREDAAARAIAVESVSALRERGVDGVILGCTEIPLLMGELADAPGLLNPAALLAEAAVARAIGAPAEEPARRR